MRRPVRIAALICLGLIVSIIALVPLYRFVDPPSLTIARRALAGADIRQDWRPLEGISRHLPIAVIMAEDARFCRHRGVDWQAVEEVLDDYQDAAQPRGASTIAMQTAKNLYLWESRSYLRKALEIPLALMIDAFWPKRRQIEVYLNIAEWGPGVFGAEAAARYHFKRPAAKLTRRQAALLAASLPAPNTRIAGRPGPVTRAIARRIEARMRTAGPWVSCLAGKAQ